MENSGSRANKVPGLHPTEPQALCSLFNRTLFSPMAEFHLRKIKRFYSHCPPRLAHPAENPSAKPGTSPKPHTKTKTHKELHQPLLIYQRTTWQIMTRRHCLNFGLFPMRLRVSYSHLPWSLKCLSTISRVGYMQNKLSGHKISQIFYSNVKENKINKLNLLERYSGIMLISAGSNCNIK